MTTLLDSTGKQIRNFPTNSQSLNRRIGGLSINLANGYLSDREINAKLRGRTKYRTYANILSQCTTVSASVNWFLGLIGRAKWNVVPGEADSSGEIAERFEQFLFEDPMTSWNEINRRAAMSRFFGFSIQEIVFRPSENGFTIEDIYPIAPQIVERWHVVNGNLEAVQVRPENSAAVTLERRKLIYLADKAISDSPAGLGLFRLIAPDALRLLEIENLEWGAYQADVGGMPVARAPLADIAAGLPEDADPNTDKRVEPLINAIKRARRGENGQGLLLDSKPWVYEDREGNERLSTIPQFDYQLVKGEAKGFSDLRELKTTYKKDIARTLGTESLLLGEQNAGSFALSSNKDHQFELIVESQLEENARAFQRDLIELLAIANNISPEQTPRLTVERAENQDPTNQISAFEKMVAAGLVDPEDPIVNEFRELFGYSPMPEEIAQRLAIEPAEPTPTEETE